MSDSDVLMCVGEALRNRALGGEWREPGLDARAGAGPRDRRRLVRDRAQMKLSRTTLTAVSSVLHFLSY
jgi:hypothetical protein